MKSSNRDKPITVGYTLRKKYLPTPACSKDTSLDNYIKLLVQQGLWIHPSIQPAWFQLKNKLKYPGLKTKSDLFGPQVLVKVPTKLLLTTKKALEQPKLKQVYKQLFYHCSSNWQDRVLATYLMYIYSTKQTIWYEMMKCMSKDIDILCFWSPEDIEKFGDKSIKILSNRDLQYFNCEWFEFQQVMKKYNVIPAQLVTRQNYKWIYTHLVSRCFGKFLQCVTMVPYCQFFNHHISDVIYDFEYNPQNPFKNEETIYPPTQNYQTEQQRDQVSSSDGSNQSQDLLDQFEFDYSNVNIHKINWGSKKMSLNLNQKEVSKLKTSLKEFQNWLQDHISWNDWSIIFVGQLLEKIRIIENEFMAGRRKYIQSMESLINYKNIALVYRKQIIEFYEMYKKHGWRYQPQNRIGENTQEEDYEIKKEFPLLYGDKFDHFTMRMNKKDQFYSNNQVYFCYGRLSNRTLLQRYGITLEGNKYEHVWLKIDIIRFLEGYPDIIEKMQNYRLSVKRRFKIKKSQFNLEIIQFFRMTKWDLIRHKMDQLFYVYDLDHEASILELVNQFYSKQLSHYEQEGVLEGQLYSEYISYHDYFIVVYKLQKVKIIKQQMNLIEIILNIIRKLKQGIPFEKATEVENSDSSKQRQDYWYLSKYFKRLQHFKK